MWTQYAQEANLITTARQVAIRTMHAIAKMHLTDGAPIPTVSKLLKIKIKT